MNQNDYKEAFSKNEIEANKYTARCMLVMSAVILIVWLLNIMGLFIVPDDIMAIAAIGSLILLLIPSLFVCILKKQFKLTKLMNMACCILAITLLAAAMPKHGIVAWAAPIALSCHYYSKKFTYITLAISIVCMSIALFAGAYLGEWDISFFGENIEVEDGLIYGSYKFERIFTPYVYKRMFLFMLLPRAMILVGICAVCSTLAERTHKLLEKQVKDSVEKQRIASELDVATHIQASMLPLTFPNYEEFDIYATMIPAKEVGGDFYDFFMVDEKHLAIVVADVSGKGVPAALFMVIGKTLIKDHTTVSNDDLGNIFSKINNLLCESNSEGLFITAFEGVLNLETGEFRYVNAGHEMPFIYRASDNQFSAHKIKPGFVLAGMEEMKYRAGSLQLEEGDIIFQYTDGVTEATNANNELFGMERLGESLNSIADKTPKAITDTVKSDIDKFVGSAPQFDDITMLCLEFKEKLYEK